MVNIISSSFQFCFKDRERSTCFCFTCEVVPNAYSPVQSFFVPRMSSTAEYEDLLLSYVAPILNIRQPMTEFF